MAFNGNDSYLASRLIYWGMRHQAHPAQEPEYRKLIDGFIDHSEFRELVRKIARGLGLIVVDVTDLGMVLGVEEDSVFALRPSDFYSSYSGADERLLYGLIQVAIAARIFPRARDLEEDANLARQPVTVDEIEEMLRGLCEQFVREASGEPDPAASEELAGFYEAWRVYQGRVAAKETAGDRRASGTTRRMIERTLDRLCEFGCFLKQTITSRTHYQPLWRYQVLVKEFAATTIYERVRKVLEAGSTELSREEQ